MKVRGSGFASGNVIFTDAGRGLNQYGGFSGAYTRIGDQPWTCPFCKPDCQVRGYDALYHLRNHLLADVSVQAMEDKPRFYCSAKSGKRDIVLSVTDTMAYSTGGRTGSRQQFLKRIRKRNPGETPPLGFWSCTLCWTAHRVSSADLLDHLCEILIKQGMWREEREGVALYVRLKDGQRSERYFAFISQPVSAPMPTTNLGHPDSRKLRTKGNARKAATSAPSGIPLNEPPRLEDKPLATAVRTTHDQGTVAVRGASSFGILLRRKAVAPPSANALEVRCPHCGKMLKSEDGVEMHVARTPKCLKKRERSEAPA